MQSYASCISFSFLDSFDKNTRFLNRAEVVSGVLSFPPFVAKCFQKKFRKIFLSNSKVGSVLRDQNPSNNVSNEMCELTIYSIRFATVPNCTCAHSHTLTRTHARSRSCTHKLTAHAISDAHTRLTIEM